ncbi:phosphotransferase [Streptomyces sp. NPDC002536]
MTLLPGAPLRGCSVTTDQLVAMAGALTRMYESVPRGLVAQLPYRVWNEHQAVRGIHTWYEQLHRTAPPRIVERAVAEGMRWLELTPSASAAEPDVPVVFGQADGNLANFLWDGASVRIVDFEASGRSDRSYELADVVEHVSVWADSDFNTASFVGLFDLTRSERLRLGRCRRLISLMWLLVYALRDPEQAYNPSGTAERQADRLLTLLG